jgi:hypothetical protein
MGHLLSSAIKMQGAANAPTLTVNMTDLTGDGSLEIYKNGALYTTIIGNGASIVPIVAGDTFYIIVFGFGGYVSWLYYINGVFQNVGSSFGFSVTSPTYTASGTNAYTLNGVSDTPG